MLTPIPNDRRTRRFANLAAGLALFGISVALMLSAGLGVDSWDVLHQGLAERMGVPVGWVINAVSLLALALWIPLRQRPGFGTVANAIVVGVVADASLAILPDFEHLPTQISVLGLGILANGFATGLYIGAGLGPGPRDGLMTGVAMRTGRSIRSVRLAIELTVLSVGWTLGGPVGAGTVLFAVAIGPLSQYFMSKLAVGTDALLNHHDPRALPGARTVDARRPIVEPGRC